MQAILAIDAMETDQQKSNGAPPCKTRSEQAEWLWAILPLFGGALLVPWGADWPRIVALVPLWTIAGILLLGQGTIYGCYAFASSSPAWNTDRLRWTHRRDRRGLGRLLTLTAFILGLLIAPVVAGHVYLASCFAIGWVMAIGCPDPKAQESDRDPDKPRRIGRPVFWILLRAVRLVGWCVSIVAKAVFMLALWLAETVAVPFELLSKRRLARRLRAAFDVPGGAVYFVYSEQHQFDRFLGPGGVLQAAIGGIVARNWRNDIQPGWSTRSKTPLAEPERALLRRFRISNMRDHLPFAVVIAADDRLHAFHLSKPYRMRQRDGGAALRDEENRLRLFIAVAD